MNNVWKTGSKIVLLVFLLCFSYAFLRYNIVRSVSFEQVPLYINNKAISFSATVLIGLSFLLGPLARFFPQKFVKHLPLRKPLGLFGFGMASVHAIISLVLFDKQYYPRYYSETGRLTLNGESALLFGILAFVIFFVVAVTSLPSMEERMQESQWKTIQRLGYLAYIFVFFHVAIMGHKGWFMADSWQYGMVSISLISSLFIIFVCIMRILVVLLPQKKLQD
jgi:DMSO/TMAO reductase YedYZ heme-binding membrane subunit